MTVGGCDETGAEGTVPLLTGAVWVAGAEDAGAEDAGAEDAGTEYPGAEDAGVLSTTELLSAGVDSTADEVETAALLEGISTGELLGGAEGAEEFWKPLPPHEP